MWAIRKEGVGSSVGAGGLTEHAGKVGPKASRRGWAGSDMAGAGGRQGALGRRGPGGGGARLPGSRGSVLKRVLWGQSDCKPVRVGCPVLLGWRPGASSETLAGASVHWAAGATCSLFQRLPQAPPTVLRSSLGN